MFRVPWLNLGEALAGAGAAKWPRLVPAEDYRKGAEQPIHTPGNLKGWADPGLQGIFLTRWHVRSHARRS